MTQWCETKTNRCSRLIRSGTVSDQSPCRRGLKSKRKTQVRTICALGVGCSDNGSANSIVPYSAFKRLSSLLMPLSIVILWSTIIHWPSSQKSCEISVTSTKAGMVVHFLSFLCNRHDQPYVQMAFSVPRVLRYLIACENRAQSVLQFWGIGCPFESLCRHMYRNSKFSLTTKDMYDLNRSPLVNDTARTCFNVKSGLSKSTKSSCILSLIIIQGDVKCKSLVV